MYVDHNVVVYICDHSNSSINKAFSFFYTHIWIIVISGMIKCNHW